MPNKKAGEGGYCNCADCKADQAKRSYTAVAKRGRGGVPVDPIVLEGFWERVRAYSALRDWERRTRR